MGKGCLIMDYVHLAHDCLIGNEVVIVNGTELSGHIIVEDRAFISGMVGAHQVVRFGELSMTGGMRLLEQTPEAWIVRTARRPSIVFTESNTTSSS